MKDENMIFPKGERVESSYFIGDVWIKRLVEETDIFNLIISNVTFEKGARNNWHKHPGGQILIVTDGKGYYQEEGKPVQIIKKGDVIKIYPGVKHWHGASPDSHLSHIAIATNTQIGVVEWFEPVTDDYYYKL